MTTTTRLFVLSSLFLAMPACDPKAGAPDVKDGQEVGDGEPVADFGRAGEECDQSELSSDCQIGGVAGREFCVWSTANYNFVWTACLTETCAKEGDTRDCEDGTQRCVVFDASPDSREARWGECLPPDECKPGEQKECGLIDEGEDISMGCTVEEETGRHVWNWEDCNTPLVLSFGDAIEFAPTSVSAVDFDIRGGAGGCSRADWPTAATPWLALDRDGNGSIDGGHELFGSATRLAAGSGPHNGFQALAELDSDRDGKITPADARWGELVLWADHDADRRSSGWELLPLSSFEIVEIDLGYTVRRECDARGNCGLERASFVYRKAGQRRTGEVVDVRVACE